MRRLPIMISLSLILLLFWMSLATGKRLKDRIYVPVDTASFCFRRTNGTHQFGCTSNFNGNVGVVHLIENDQDLDWITEKGSHPPYVAAFLPKTFSDKNLRVLKDNEKRVAGAILLDPLNSDTVTSPERYSDDRKCPNPISSLYKDTSDQCDPNDEPWNPEGTGNGLGDFPFPIFITRNDSTTDFIINDCFNNFNKPSEDGEDRDWPLCAIELKSHMYAAIDSVTCLRRSNMVNIVNPTKFCDEMGDYNVFLFLKERESYTDTVRNDSVAVIMARLDAMTMFDGMEFGADSPVTNIVALLETARLLKEANLPLDDGQTTNVLFAFMYGEAFDYMGSSRFVYDLEKSLFPNELDNEKFSNGQQTPLTLSNLRYVLEVGPLFNLNSGQRLFAHTDRDYHDPDSIELIPELIQKASENGLAMSESPRPVLPPASVQSLLKKNRSIPSIYLSDFEREYSNKYFHSVYDTGEKNLAYNHSNGESQQVVDHISKVAKTLAEFVFDTTSSRLTRIPNFKPNRTLINELLHCYLDTAHCSLFMAASNEKTPPFYAKIPNTPLPQYVGVDWKSQFHGIFTRNVLAYLTGEKVNGVGNLTEEDCVTPEKQNLYEYIFLKGEITPEWWPTSDSAKACNKTSECGYCYKTLSFRRSGVSPAFAIEDYDLSDQQYASWAESVWKEVGARIFLKASPALEKGFFACGVIVFLFSSFFVFWVERKSADIFEAVASEDGPNNGRSSNSTTGTTQGSSREELQRPAHL